MPKKLVLFDADETLWTTADHDYISHVPSVLASTAPDAIKRLADGKVFRLKHGVTEAFAELQLHAARLKVGVVSDNEPEPVKMAMQLFGLWNVIDVQAFNVRLWKGFCPKHEMVLEILRSPTCAGITPENVYLIDDKDYSREAKEIGIHFIEVGPDTDLAHVVEQILKSMK